MLRYKSADAIRDGDRITYFAEAGTVEFGVEPDGPPEYAWFRQEYGSGVMIQEPKVMGHVFLSEPESDDMLLLVGRADGPDGAAPNKALQPTGSAGG